MASPRATKGYTEINETQCLISMFSSDIHLGTKSEVRFLPSHGRSRQFKSAQPESSSYIEGEYKIYITVDPDAEE